MNINDLLKLEYERLQQQSNEIDQRTKLQRISKEELDKQFIRIQQAEQLYINNKKTLLTRHMSYKDEQVAISMAKEYPGTYICSCFGSFIRKPCNGMIIFKNDLIECIVCDNGGDGGISIMKLLNQQGFSL